MSSASEITEIIQKLAQHAVSTGCKDTSVKAFANGSAEPAAAAAPAKTNTASKKRADFIKWCVDVKYKAAYDAYHAALSEEQRAPKHNMINRNTFAAPKMVGAAGEKSEEYSDFCTGFDSGSSEGDSDAKQAGAAAAAEVVKAVAEAATAPVKKVRASAKKAAAEPAAAAPVATLTVTSSPTASAAPAKAVKAKKSPAAAAPAVPAAGGAGVPPPAAGGAGAPKKVRAKKGTAPAVTNVADEDGVASSE